MYMLMDTESFHIKSELKIDFVKPILTVASFLEAHEAKNLLLHPLLEIATGSVNNDMKDKSKDEISRELERKNQALQEILRQFTSETLSEEDIRRVVDSIADSNAYYSFNVRPVERMISFLTEHFDPNHPDSNPIFTLDLNMRPRKLFSSFSSTYVLSCQVFKA